MPRDLPESLITFARRFRSFYPFMRAGWQKARGAFWQLLRVMSPPLSRIGPSKGTFSALDLLRQGRLEGRLVEDAHPNPETGSKPLRRLMGHHQAELGSWPRFWTRHAEARLVGRTLIVQDEHKRISYEAAFGSLCYRRDPAFNYLSLPKPVNLRGNWTSVISQWSEGFYHWFLDALPRLALLNEFPKDTRVLVPPNLAPYQVETLGWLGLQSRHRPTKERHLVVENFYFSSPPAMTGCYDPFTPRFLRECFLKHADVDYHPPHRFYIRRVGAKRGIHNEQEVIDFFSGEGWGIVDTAQLTMARQIRLFANAEAICALHGAALTNLLWCSPGVRVLELVADTFINGVYEGLSARLGLKHTFLLCPGDNAFRARVDINALRRAYALLMDLR